MPAQHRPIVQLVGLTFGVLAASRSLAQHRERASSSPPPHTASSSSPSPSSSPPPHDDESEQCASPRIEIDRDHHCCDPGQHWAHDRCEGSPVVCAPGYVPTRDRHACEPAVCRDGRVRDADGVHCCWPGQHVEAAVGRCIGEVPQCPEGASRLGAHDCAARVGPLSTGSHRRVPARAVWIPGGSFPMSRGGERSVTLEPFAIDRNEVTIGEYARCVHANRCDAPHDAFASPRAAGLPRTEVTFAMARQYCGFVGGRLPTEAEWELAARGYDRRDYPWGARLPDCSLARFAGCGTSPVVSGALAAGASPFGVRDMAGNVAEWVNDRYGALVWASEWNPTGPLHGRTRVVRGGSFDDAAVDIRTSARHERDPDEARYDVGFRCAY